MARTAKSRIRRAIERLGPYASVFLLAVPLAIVEPLKLVAVVIAGSGHWISGTATIVCAYAFSLLVVERLFLIVKPKLLRLPWFAALWHWFVAARGAVLGWLGLNRMQERLAKQPRALKSQVLKSQVLKSQVLKSQVAQR
jgi:hypothetical protein